MEHKRDSTGVQNGKRSCGNESKRNKLPRLCRHENLLLITALPFMLLFCVSLWLIQGSLPVAEIYSENGLWDLRDIDFSKTNVRFTGKVEYIPGVLYTPAEFENHKEDVEIVDTYEHPAAYGTSRIRLYVPPGVNYVVSESSPLSSDRIYINGEWMEDIGCPTDSVRTTKEGDALFYYTVHADGGIIEIVQQVSNYAHRKNESQAGYVVGTVPLMRAFVSRTYVTAAVLAGCFMTLFLVHITLWFLFRGYKANLYFSLFCLTFVLRTVVTGPKLVTALFPDFPWFAAFAVEYITVAAASVLYVLIFHVMFPGAIQRWFRIFLIAASALFAGCHIFLDSLAISRLLIYYQAVMGFTIVYVLIRGIMKIRRVSLPQVLFLAGGGLMMYTTVRDILFYRDIFIPPYGNYANAPMSETGLLMFVFLQMTAVFIGTIREMDEVRVKEQKLADENAALDRVNKLRTDVMNTLSHELRTPLAVMMGYAELAVKELKMKGVDAETTADLDTIASEAGRLAELVGEAHRLTLSKDIEKHKCVYSPEAVISQTARLYQPILKRRGTALSLDLAPGLPNVYGSRDELTQVLFNLLTNAGRHTEDGRVTISVEYTDDYITISVSDDGTGISPDFLPHAFERYAHEDPDGTGLGLAICKEIVEACGGEIMIAGGPGGGTAVTFTMPVYKEDLDG